jgi:hypothetical protein
MTERSAGDADEAWSYRRRFPKAYGPVWKLQTLESGIVAASESYRTFMPWEYMATIVISKTTMLALDADRIGITIGVSLMEADQVSSLRRVVSERATRAQLVIQ